MESATSADAKHWWHDASGGSTSELDSWVALCAQHIEQKCASEGPVSANKLKSQLSDTPYAGFSDWLLVFSMLCYVSMRESLSS